MIADNLNTHVSESVVRLVARLCNIEDDLGEKGKSGVLASMATRKLFSAPKPQDQLSLHAQARFLAQPDRDLVLHPRAQTPASRQLHFQRTFEGSHRSLHRLLQSRPRQALQVDHDRQTARRITAQMGFVLPARRTKLRAKINQKSRDGVKLFSAIPKDASLRRYTVTNGASSAGSDQVDPIHMRRRRA